VARNRRSSQESSSRYINTYSDTPIQNETSKSDNRSGTSDEYLGLRSSSSTAPGEKTKRPHKGAFSFSGGAASPLRRMLYIAITRQSRLILDP
jgi:hypothetical protein